MFFFYVMLRSKQAVNRNFNNINFTLQDVSAQDLSEGPVESTVRLPGQRHLQVPEERMS